MRKILIVFGTRPEAIKLCPLVKHLKTRLAAQTVVAVTGQHGEMLTQVLEAFQVKPDYNLGIMTPGQSLYQSTSRMIAALDPVISTEQPDLVIVQGDTTTTFCGALAAFYRKIPVAHVEAGLRTGDFQQPFPEEMNRVLTGKLAALHFAATELAAENLFREGVDPTTVRVTGNTGIDAVLETRDRLESGELTPEISPNLDAKKELIVVTAHRRENFGAGLDGICTGLEWLADRGDTQIAFAMHPNPMIQQTVMARLGGNRNIRLMPALDYVSFVELMRRSYMIVTDSGGIQEEAPSLGKPVLVLREKTERPEAVTAGTATLVGTDPRKIYFEASRLLDNELIYRARSLRHNPYGDGQACERISAEIGVFLGLRRPLAAAARA